MHCSPVPTDTPNDAIVPLSHGDEHWLHCTGGSHDSAEHGWVLHACDVDGSGTVAQNRPSTITLFSPMHCTLRLDTPVPHDAEQACHGPVHHEYLDTGRVWLLDGERLVVAVMDALQLTLCVPDQDRLDDTDADSDSVILTLADGLALLALLDDGDSLDDVVSLLDSLSLALGDGEAVTLEDALTVVDVDTDRVSESVAETVGVMVVDSEAVKLTVEDVLRLSV